MRRIHQLFIESEQEQIRHMTVKNGRRNLCWYPSAGIDFRYIKMLEEEGLNNSAAGQPLVYLHTDIRLPEEWDSSKKSITSSFFVVGKHIGQNMRITNVIEIHPKIIISEVSREVCSWGADVNMGRVFFLDVEIDTIYQNRKIRIPVSIFYFIAENLMFLINVLLRYQVRIDTLIHIKDGGGTLGGSQIPMNFIYQVAHSLKFKRVVCDESPESKIFNTSADFSVLKNELIRCERNIDSNLPHIFHKRISEISERNIRTTWEGRLIDPGQIIPNEYKPPDGSYYDWRIRRCINSEHSAGLNARPCIAEGG